MNIVLLGFMGTGKTEVAKRLAENLGMQFVEMDSVIEEREGISINDIFSEKGEPYFRKVESDVVKDLSDKNGLVISAGGGVVLNQNNIDNFQRNGVLICLNATPQEIYNRVKNEKYRPLLNVKDPLKRIEELLNFRRPYYDKIPLQIDTTEKSIDEVVDEIKGFIR